jgi:hypothetical protein
MIRMIWTSRRIEIEGSNRGGEGGGGENEEVVLPGLTK